jgi:hypothetical protein
MTVIPLLNRVRATLLGVALLLAACAAGPAADEGAAHRETYYYDANLGFALEHPEGWSRSKGGSDLSAEAAGWTWTPEKAGKPAVRVAVAALPAPAAAGGEERLEANFKAAHPGFIVTSRQNLQLPAAGTPALQVVGYTPDRTFLVLFVTSGRRGFVLELSAPPEDFDRFRPAFEEMAGSFIVLE